MDGDHMVGQLRAAADAGSDFTTLQEMAIRLIHESQPAFHWTGIYELFPDNILRLGPFIGAATDHVFIGVGRGVCGTAVAEKRNINIPDVRACDNYLACSNETRSELVVLIRTGDTIHAQIDLDSHDPNAFTDAMEAEIQKVADFLASRYTGRSTLEGAA